MLKMSTQVETIVNAYKTLSKIPSVLGGRLNNSGTRVSAKWSVRNLDRGKTTKYLTDYVLDDNLNLVSQSEYPADVSNVLLSAVSPQETFKAVIREEKDSKEAKKQFLEVWSRSELAHCIDLTALDLHGDVYADSEFGGLDWSADEGSLVYVAERKLKKSEPYVKRKAEEKPKPDGSGEAPAKKGEEFIYREDWGEQLVGKHLSVIVVVRLQDESFTIVESDVLPEHCCPGQVRFSPDGKRVAGVAWPTEPRRLGLIFCTNRPSFVFEIALDGIDKKVSPEGFSVRSPRYTPQGDLVWLQRPSGGPHHACHALMRRKGERGNVETVVDIVQDKRQIEDKAWFHGLYGQSLPSRGFSADGRLLFSSPQQLEVRAYALDLESGRIADISNQSSPGSTTVLDVRNDVVLAACSSLTKPSQLFVARLPPAGREAQIRWLPVSLPRNLPSGVADSTVQYMQLQHSDCDDAVKSFSALYFAPKQQGDELLPLIVWPHGGPHTSFVNAYSLEATLFNMLGFACVQVNYRGSTGAGQAAVEFIPKRIGDADVKDCKLTTDEAVRQFRVDPNKVFLTGGSHGGFLVTHLSGQYPDTYRAVVSRNPVTDVASMFNSTDIADWCAVEAGFEFTEKGAISEEQLLAMRRASPLVHVHRVKAPTCLMLGSGDKRVPHYQGLEYARRLKANGVEVRVYLYDDNHSLSSPAAEMDNLINGACWFMDHLTA